MTSRGSLLRVGRASLVAVSCLFLLAPLSARPAETAGSLRAASCADDCNSKASLCLDGCEEKFKNDDKERVTCKLECANARQTCEKRCGG
jgi:hypothetical protein